MTLVELMVAMAVFVILLAITGSIVVAVSRQSSSALAAGRETETAQTSLSGVAQFVQGAVSPFAAFQAEGQTAASQQADPSSAASLCWDDAANTADTTLSGSPAVETPGPFPQSPLLGADPGDDVAAPVPYHGNLVDPASLSIVYAHDYALELCAYPPGHTTPEVFEIFMDTTACSGSWCSLDVVRFAPYLGPTSATTPNDYAPPDPLTAPDASVVDVVHNVWCDATCRAVGADATTTPSWSCWSYAAAGVPTSGWPATCSSTLSSDTPPLFTYLGGRSAAVTGNDPSRPLDLSCTPAGTPVTACAPAVSGTTSTDDTVYLAGAGITAVSVRMTILGDALSANDSSASSASPPVSVDQTVPLPNLAAAVAS